MRGYLDVVPHTQRRVRVIEEAQGGAAIGWRAFGAVSKNTIGHVGGQFIVAGLSRVRLAGLREPGHIVPLRPLEAPDCGLATTCSQGRTSHNRDSEPIIDLISCSPMAGLSASPAPDSGESGHDKTPALITCVTGCAPLVRMDDCIETPR